jgi:hypothetical protein
MCTVVGIQTGHRDEQMAKGDTKRRITFVKVTEVIPGIRGASKKCQCAATQSSASVDI